jgi:hypothetical protein
MRIVETALRQNIMRATRQRTGALANVTSTWRWRLVIPGKGSRVVTSASDLPTFTRGTMLVLEPASVPYATIVNMRVLGSAKLQARARRRKNFMGPQRPTQSVGFLGATVRALRARAEFRQFSISVVFTRAFQVAGEISRKQGTGNIVIKLKGR